MICQHCGKDINKVYIDGVATTREAAEESLRYYVSMLDALMRQGAYGENSTKDLDDRFDAYLAKASQLEVALGY